MDITGVVIVKKATELETILVRHTTRSQAQFYLESRGHSFAEYLAAHDAYQRTLSLSLAALPPGARTQVLTIEQVLTYRFRDDDLILAVGGTGLFVNTAKYVGDQRIIFVNADPAHADAALATCNPEELGNLLRNMEEGKHRIEDLTMAEATLDDGQTLLALNDLYIGRRTHVSARYDISHDGRQERQSSDGIIVSTGTGSTGWLTALYAGASALCGRPYLPVAFPRSANYLSFGVEGPFPSMTNGIAVVKGMVTREKPLKVLSHMPEGGVIFSDGIESDYLAFNAGATATIMPSARSVRLVRKP